MSLNQKISLIINILVMIQGSVTISYLFFRAKKIPVLYSLFAVEALIVMWLFFATVESMSVTNEELLFALKFALFPISMIGGVGLIFALLYGGFISAKNKFVMAVIMIPLIITYLPALTNKYFYLIVLEKSIDSTVVKWGVSYIINLMITYIYVTISFLIIMRQIYREFYKSKRKFILIILAIVFPISINALTASKIVTILNYDLTPASFSVLFTLFTWAIFRYRFLNIVPEVKHDIFYEMEEAVIITDDKNRILEHNRTASIEFAAFFDMFECKTINELFIKLKNNFRDKEKYIKIEDKIENFGKERYSDFFELSLDNENAYIRYMFYVKPLFDRKGKTVARIFIIKNSTDFVKAQLEDERKRISGDIHDNLSNMINVISMNLEYAIKHFDNEKDALKCINTAYDTVKGVRIKVRRILDELVPTDIESVGLINSLEALFKKIVGSGMELDFYYNGIEDDFISKKRHAYVIYKACMESINNSFFNGKADKINIVLTYKDGLIKLLIVDNGVGCEKIQKGRGLTQMEKNISALRGKVEYGSSGEGGFNVRIEIPL